ncbi:hypothetical protein RJ640_005998, partial [Escallonia rubra]
MASLRFFTTAEDSSIPWTTNSSLHDITLAQICNHGPSRATSSYHTVTEVHGRTFGVWTLLTCTLCILCAFNLENRPLYLATLLSFVYAFGHFLTEHLIYHTMAIGNLTTVGIFAGTTAIFSTSFVII